MSISLSDLILSFPPSVPWRRPISCVCSKVTFLGGMVTFTTGLTGWVGRSWFSAISLVCFVCVGIVGNVIFRAKVCLITVIVVVTITGNICVVLVLVVLSFELTALVSVVTWFLAVVSSWFGFSWIWLCGLVHHSIYLQRIWSFKRFSSNSLPGMTQSVYMFHFPNAPE